MSYASLAIALLSATALTGCLECVCPPDPIITERGTFGDTVCVWLASNADTYGSEREPEMNFGHHGTLAVARGLLGTKHAYVRFTRPLFPAGTEILSAKMELYHHGKNEDGTSDDITLDVRPLVGEAWGPLTLTWNNRPDRSESLGGQYGLKLRSQAWSTTRDIVESVREMFRDGGTNNGFRISLPPAFFNSQVEKGFASNNDFGRASNDMGHAPRLLLRIVLPKGKTTADIVAPFLPAGHDLDRLQQPILVAQFAAGSRFPAAWESAPEW